MIRMSSERSRDQRGSQLPSGRKQAMAKNFRRARAAKKAINSRGNHGLLGLVIFDEKLVCENYKKLVNSKANSSLTLLKWAKNEENKAINDVFSKVFEVTGIWTTVWTKFHEEYQKYRGAFKELLLEEQILDEVTKQEAMYTAKLNKLQKQFQQMKRSSKVITSEMAEVISQAEKAQAELEVKHTKHEIFKARRLRTSLLQIADGLQKWAEQSIAVSNAYRDLANLIPDTPTQLTEENIYPGAGQSRTIVSELATELNIEPEFSAELATASRGSQGAYLYAVSPPLRHNSSEGTYMYSSTADAKCGKGRKPQPLPKTKPKIAAAKLRNQHLRRPVSDSDLKPAPPASPPPPLPMDNSCPEPSQHSNGKLWYARSKLLERTSSDGEDSDGYTEPIRVANHVTHSISDSVLNRLTEREELTAREPGTGEVYQHLRRMAKEDINDNASYVDLFG